jgi:threonine 3-dehydrogenase
VTGAMIAVLKASAAPGCSVTSVPIPGIGPLDVLVRVKVASICGTDVHIHAWDTWAQGRVRPPLVLGHESFGEVAEVGAAVSLVEVGTPVAIEPQIADGTCPQCRSGNPSACENQLVMGVDRPGCFAEYAVVPETNVYPLPAGVDGEQAVLLTPLGSAVQATLAGPVTALVVAVIGAGPVGCCAAAVARAAGAARVLVTDVRPLRLALARRVGADVGLDVSAEDAVDAVLRETGGHGADVVVEASGHPEALSQALRMLRHGGRIALLGIPSGPVTLDAAAAIVTKGALVQGVGGRRLWHTWDRAFALLRSGRLDLAPLLTHRLRLAEIEQALALIGTGEAAKVVLRP